MRPNDTVSMVCWYFLTMRIKYKTNVVLV
jgi:hypothetical protein